MLLRIDELIDRNRLGISGLYLALEPPDGIGLEVNRNGSWRASFQQRKEKDSPLFPDLDRIGFGHYPLDLDPFEVIAA